MAVQSDTSRISYAGNNSTSTSYAVPFVFLENAHLKAIAKTSAGVETVVTLTNHAGAGNVNGGTVRTSVAIPATSTLTIYRDVPITQTTTYAEGGDFPAASHERALDKLTQISQQNARKLGSALRLSEANQIGELNPPLTNQQHILSSVGGAPPSWQALPSLSIGPVIATGSTTARSVQDRFADVINVKDFGAVANCTAQGVGTDVVPALVAAVNYAVSTIGNGAHIVLPAGRYRAATSGVLNLQGKVGITISLEGVITPDAITASVITVENGEALHLSASIYEGGIFNGWNAAQPFGPCNYGTTRDVAASGGQEMFLLRGLRNFRVDLHAHSYAGRLVRTSERANASHPFTQAIKGTIVTERSMSDFSKPRVAQCLWADYGTAPAAGNWGSLERLVCDFDYWGPVWKGLTDVEVSLIDAAFSQSGVKFYGCYAITGSVWYIGDVDSIGSDNHLEFGTHNGTGCAFVNVPSIRFLNAGNGMVADQLFNAEFTVHHIAPSASLPFATVASLNNCDQVRCTVWAFGYGASLLSITGNGTDNITANADSVSAILSSFSTSIGSDVLGAVRLTPSTNNVTSGTSSVVVGGTGYVLIENPIMGGIVGSHHFDITSSGNSVYIHGGFISPTPNAYKTQAPRAISFANGVASLIPQNIRSNEGAVVAGAGGSFSFGIDAAGFQNYAPLAQIKGNLINSAGTELQGGVKLQVRPTGSAGQVLTDALTVSATSTDGETYATLTARISGSNVDKRVKVGAAGSGPSGTGRALFVDN
jgi:hypothetical protein